MLQEIEVLKNKLIIRIEEILHENNSANDDQISTLVKDICSYINEFNDPSILDFIAEKNLNIIPFLISHCQKSKYQDLINVKKVYEIAIKKMPQFIPQISSIITDMMWDQGVHDTSKLGFDLYKISIRNVPRYINQILPKILNNIKIQNEMCNGWEKSAFEEALDIDPWAVAQTIPIVIDLFSNDSLRKRLKAVEIYGFLITRSPQFIKESEIDKFYDMIFDKEENVRNQASYLFEKAAKSNPSLLKLTKNQISKLPNLFLNNDIPYVIIKALKLAINATPELIPQILELIRRTFLDIIVNKYNNHNQSTTFDLFQSILQRHSMTLSYEDRDLMYAQFTHYDYEKRKNALELLNKIAETYPELIERKVSEKIEEIKIEKMAIEPFNYDFCLTAIRQGSKLIDDELIRQILEVLSLDFRPIKNEEKNELLEQKRSPQSLELTYRRAIKVLEIIIEKAPHYIPQILDACRNLLFDRNSMIRIHAFEVYKIFIKKVPESISEKDLDRIFGKLVLHNYDVDWREKMYALSTCKQAIKSVPRLINKKKVNAVLNMFRDRNVVVKQYACDAYAYIIKNLPQFVDQIAINQIASYLKEVEPHYDKESNKKYYPEDEMDLMWAAYNAFITALKNSPEYISQAIPLILQEKINYVRFLQCLRNSEEFSDETLFYEFSKKLMALIVPSKLFNLFLLLAGLYKN